MHVERRVTPLMHTNTNAQRQIQIPGPDNVYNKSLEVQCSIDQASPAYYGREKTPLVTYLYWRPDSYYRSHRTKTSAAHI